MTPAALDRALFLWLNGVATHPWLDAFMPLFTSGRALGLLAALGLFCLVAFAGRRGRVAAAAMVVAVALSDVTASQFLKPWVGRERPCHAVEEARVLVRCGGRNGFPSNHAANAGAGAVVISLFYARWRWPAAALALAIGYSRVYVGVHYPGDVVAGWALGFASGAGLLALAGRSSFIKSKACRGELPSVTFVSRGPKTEDRKLPPVELNG
jgi:undecaprenyl-diphosphatase